MFNRWMFLVFSFLVSGSALSATMQYNGVPLVIQIPVNDEIILQFSEPQLVGRIEKVNEFVQFRGVKNQVLVRGLAETDMPYDLVFRGTKTGEIILARVSVGRFEDAAKQLLIKGQYTPKEDKTGPSEYKHASQSSLTQPERAVILTRYVNQLKGPVEALEKPPFAIVNKSSNIGKPVKGLYRKGELEVTLDEIYQGGGLTAMLMIARNVTEHTVQFDPTNVRGRWDMVQPWKWTFLPNEVGVLLFIVEGDVPDGMLEVMARG